MQYCRVVIMPIITNMTIDHHSIWSVFATFKPFDLFDLTSGTGLLIELIELNVYPKAFNVK